MKLFSKALAGTLMSIVVLLGVLSVLCQGALSGTPLASALMSLGGGAGTAAANAALDASGLKTRAESALRENASKIAAKTGMSEDEVNSAIDQLDISSWTVTMLPSDASATGSFQTTYAGTSATVTTYADPSYVTVNAMGQDVTLAVPESAQGYAWYLSYL